MTKLLAGARGPRPSGHASEAEAQRVSEANIVQIARSWIGTPYHHQASRRGVGCDCLGLVRGVYAELYGRESAPPPGYSKDLAEASGRETLLEAAREHLVEVVREHPVGVQMCELMAGDVLVFRMRPKAMAKHCGIVSWISSGHAGMVHAFEGADVCEIILAEWWRRHIAAVFRWPDEVK